MQARVRFRAMREQPEIFSGLSLESQVQNLAWTVIFVPSSFDSGELSDLQIVISVAIAILPVISYEH